MIRTLIVDDETLVRATLRTLVDWEALGYTIVQDCSDGGQALEYLKRNPVDVMFTDMKMPNVGGIELLRGLKESRAAPVSIALSGYDEFELVREAFRLGAYDYLLKSDLNAEILRALLEQLRQKYFQKTETQPQCRENLDTLFQAEQGQYAVVLFSIDDFSAQASRFGSNLALAAICMKNWKSLCWNLPGRSHGWQAVQRSGLSARNGICCGIGYKMLPVLNRPCPPWCGSYRLSGGIT